MDRVNVHYNIILFTFIIELKLCISFIKVFYFFGFALKFIYICTWHYYKRLRFKLDCYGLLVKLKDFFTIESKLIRIKIRICLTMGVYIFACYKYLIKATILAKYY